MVNKIHGPAVPSDESSGSSEVFKMRDPQIQDLNLSEGVRGGLEAILSGVLLSVGKRNAPNSIKIYLDGGGSLAKMLIKHIGDWRET